MATAAEIRAGFKATIDAMQTGLRVFPYMEPSPTTPALCIGWSAWDPAATFDAKVDWTFHLWLYFDTADLVRAQEAIDRYFAPSGANSISDAIRDTPNLGVTGVYTRLSGVTAGPMRVEKVGGGDMLAARMDCQVSA
jgi:hypothetical protein